MRQIQLITSRAAIAAALALNLVACTSDDGGATPDAGPVSSQPAPSIDAEDANAAASTLAAYRNYVGAYVTASNKGDYNAKLDRFVAEPALLTVRQDLLIKFQQGLVTKGEPTSTPKVSTVDTSRRPFTAEVEDCFDTSAWDVISKKTGKSVRTTGQATRYVVIAKAELFDDGQWRIREVSAQRERPC
ncbi:hypothetical protein KBX26_02890 [Micromonospora sp. C97]|uniref:hypothetical protein n=1 Tax=Micromonospora sp. C97 TaxID=2824883 RepID=UPI001B35FBC5|nr:hypothetical protein [Micromonospora sp. C97]MBQ1028954.1 hypothetical protein [Micromonospora sp. C97]